MRVPYETICTELVRVLREIGFTPERADKAARLFVDASRDGVYSHGLNRFPRFVRNVGEGMIDVNAEPELIAAMGAVERWDGRRGPGMLNAAAMTDRAIQLAREHTVGVVGLANTNHWMRPGNYGLQAIDANMIGIFWTNTIPNMPPWGGKEARLGNNPLVIAIPGPEPVLLDIAMSMYSYGRLEGAARAGRQMDVAGGYTTEGELTCDPEAILASGRTLPIGFWKGSGLSLALDLVASALSGGLTSHEVGLVGQETLLSQVFILLDYTALPEPEAFRERMAATLKDLTTVTPAEGSRGSRHPGAGMLETRARNLAEGIPVEEAIWNGIVGGSPEVIARLVN
ncbi:MAG: 3-dehydro-L-gulonate 2-dehydrogenase [Bacillota bacterium]|nr:3-dehydro-L-gulonate 2-dehydrogenase [Bacillota bacterium]